MISTKFRGRVPLLTNECQGDDASNVPEELPSLHRVTGFKDDGRQEEQEKELLIEFSKALN